MRGTSTAPEVGQNIDAWLPQRHTTVLLLSASAEVHDLVARVSAAAAVEVEVAEQPRAFAGRWEDISAVLVDADVAADPLRSSGLAGWRGALVIVGMGQSKTHIWAQAERLGVDSVAILPESAPWLAGFLARLQGSVTGAGVVGIVGGCGGAGASTLSIMVAAQAARRGTRTLLVDGDPLGGGLGPALGAQQLPGIGWQELLRASGSINPEQLAAALPRLGELSVLTWTASALEAGRQDPAAVPTMAFADGQAAAEVIRAARQGYGLVVVDMARSLEAYRVLASHCNGVLMVVPARARAAAAALAMKRQLPPLPMAVAVAAPLNEGDDAAMVAEAIELPLMGVMPRLRHVDDLLASERLPELLRRRAVHALTSAVLDWLSGDAVPARGRRRIGSGRRAAA